MPGINNFSQELTQKRTSENRVNKKQILPQGSYSPQDWQKMELYQQILSCPTYQNLSLPNEVEYSQFLILKQINSDNESIYHLFDQNKMKRLLSAKKQVNNIGCNYIISKNQRPKKDDYFVGKLRGNFRNNEFFVFDGGQNPSKLTQRKRKQIGFISFEDESIFSNCIQKASFLIPKPVQTPESTQSHPKYHPKCLIPKDDKQNLILEEFQKSSGKISKLENKKIYKKQLQTGDAKCDTFQNITLQSQTKQKVLILKKRSQTTYFLNIGCPLNFIQGLSFALAVFQKYKC